MRFLALTVAMTIPTILLMAFSTTASPLQEATNDARGRTEASTKTIGLKLQTAIVDPSSVEGDASDVDRAAAEIDDGMNAKLEATHQEVDFLKPTIDGRPVQLNTFELDEQGNIWACVNAPRVGRKSPSAGQAAETNVETGENALAKTESETDPTRSTKDLEPADDVSQFSPKGYVLVYRPDKSLLSQIAVPFTPTAIDLDPSDTVYIAGEGKICKMTRAGKILQMAGTPNMAGKDLEELKRDAIDDYKKQMEQSFAIFAKQKDQFKTKIDKILETPELERTARQSAQLESYQSQWESLEQILSSEAIDPSMADSLVEQKLGIPALCATANHVFVATAAQSGFAYAIWRVDTNLENPAELIAQVPGCCGQMDVEADESHLYVADNTKFCVSVYDTEGAKITSFGKRATKDDNGFGSCCNPMNVCCTQNGDMLTAESSIGKIKRFDADGKLIGYVGRARIGAGCKHVALGYDQARDRYYIQYQDKNQVCILVPNAEAVDAIAERGSSHAKLLEASKPLLGRWVRATKAPATPDARDDASSSADQDIDVAVDFDHLTSQIAEFEFIDDGKLQLRPVAKEGFLTNFTDLKWMPDAVDSQGELSLGVEHEDVIMFRISAKIVSADQAEFSFSFDGAGVESKPEVFHRSGGAR